MARNGSWIVTIGGFVTSPTSRGHHVAVVADLVKLPLGGSAENIVANVYRVHENIFHAFVPPRFA